MLMNIYARILIHLPTPIGTDAEITSAFSTANSAVERAAELCMFGVVAVADDTWALLVQLEQVNAHIATLRECFEKIRDATKQAAAAKEQVAKAGAMLLMHGDNHEVDDEEFSMSNFVQDMMFETMVSKANKSDETGTIREPEVSKAKASPAGVAKHGNTNYDDYDSDDDTDDSDFEDLLNGVMQDAQSSSALPDDAQKHVAKAAAMLDIYADDVLHDGSDPALDGCVEELREALVRAEELGMVKADLVVVTAGKELLQRFDSKSDANSSSKSKFSPLDLDNLIVSNIKSGGGRTSAQTAASGDKDGTNLYSALELRAATGDSEGDADFDSDLQDNSGSDASNKSSVKMQTVKQDIEAQIRALTGGRYGGGDFVTDAGDTVSVCDSISSNDIPTMLSDASDSDSVS